MLPAVLWLGLPANAHLPSPCVLGATALPRGSLQAHLGQSCCHRSVLLYRHPTTSLGGFGCVWGEEPAWHPPPPHSCNNNPPRWPQSSAASQDPTPYNKHILTLPNLLATNGWVVIIGRIQGNKNLSASFSIYLVL